MNNLLEFTLLVSAICLLASSVRCKNVNSEENYGTVIGIDLGTSYSCVGVVKNGRVEIIPNENGNLMTPSYVAFKSDGERLIGDAAKNQLRLNPKNTVFNVKLLVGRDFNDSLVQDDIKYLPFKVIGKNNKPYIKVQVGDEEKLFTPEEISAMVLGKMKEIAEAYLGKKVTNAVITIPANFSDAQRKATKDAATIAGLNVIRIINEPTAAAIAYGIDKKENKNILVYKLGGGTFDVSLLTIDNGDFEVLATDGNAHLGGEDFDKQVMESMIKIFIKKIKSKYQDVNPFLEKFTSTIPTLVEDIRQYPTTMQRLRIEVEKAKRILSSKTITNIEIDSFFLFDDFSEMLTRARFEMLNIELFRDTLKSIEKVFNTSRMNKRFINEIILIGGSTRIPLVQKLVRDFFDGKEPNLTINPEEAVVYGAAIQAGLLSGEEVGGDVEIFDLNPLTRKRRETEQFESVEFKKIKKESEKE